MTGLLIATSLGLAVMIVLFLWELHDDDDDGLAADYFEELLDTAWSIPPNQRPPSLQALLEEIQVEASLRVGRGRG